MILEILIIGCILLWLEPVLVLLCAELLNSHPSRRIATRRHMKAPQTPRQHWLARVFPLDTRLPADRHPTVP